MKSWIQLAQQQSKTFELAIPLTIGETYTISMNSNEPFMISVGDVFVGETVDGSLEFIATNSGDVTITSYSDISMEFEIKLELGSTPTEWSPAPEDGYGYTGKDASYHIQSTETTNFSTSSPRGTNSSLIVYNWSEATINGQSTPKQEVYEYSEKSSFISIVGKIDMLAKNPTVVGANLIGNDFSDFRAYQGATVTRNKTFPIGVFKGGRNWARATRTEFRRVSIGQYSGSLSGAGVMANATYDFSKMGITATNNKISIGAYIEVEGIKETGFRIDATRLDNTTQYHAYTVNTIRTNKGELRQVITVDSTLHKSISIYLSPIQYTEPYYADVSHFKVATTNNPNEPYSPAPEDGYGYTGGDGAYHIQTSGGTGFPKFYRGVGIKPIGEKYSVNVDIVSFNSNMHLRTNTGVSVFPVLGEYTQARMLAIGNGASDVQIHFAVKAIPDSLDFIASDPMIHIDKPKTTVKEVIITDSTHLSEFSTFDETFSISENDKTTFTFKIIEEYEDKKNPFIELVSPQSVIGLSLPEREKTTEALESKDGAYYKFKVLQRSPEFTDQGLVYTITCEDFASQVYARQGNGLAIDMTGTLRELAEEILGQTRKNNLYKDLNLNIAAMSYHDLDAKRKLGMTYTLPYVNFKGTSMGMFLPPRKNSYVSFTPNGKFIIGVEYDLKFDLVGMNNTVGTTTNPFNCLLQVVGRRADGQQVFVGPLVETNYNGNPLPLRVPFVYRDDVDYIDLMIVNDISKPIPTTGVFNVSMSTFTISKSKTRTTTRREGDTALYINHLDNFYDQFSTTNGSYYSETKMTFSIENSNLYNALVSLATLFNAEVRFDYQDNAFYFVSKDFRRYKGLALHPDVNLSSISRPESATEFATVFHLQGGNDIEGALPALPTEWRQYLSDCVSNNFSSAKWFSNYSPSAKYTDQIQYVKEYIDASANLEERNLEIKKFAEQLDKMPNFESTLYNFSYFRKRAMMTDTDYNDLTALINNTVRKLNTSLNINTYKYYSLYSDHSSQLLQLSFYINAVNVERKFQYQAEGKLKGPDAPEKYTSAWVSYMNQIDGSVAAEQNFLREIDTILGLKPDGHVDITPGSFAYNALMIFGYTNSQENGITKLLKENKIARDKKNEELVELLEKIEELEKQINDSSITAYVKESLSTDLAGAKREVDNIARFLGQLSGAVDSAYFMPGIYVLEAQLYEEVNKRITKYPNDIPTLIKDQGQSLYDLVINRESEFNLVTKKELELQVLMDKYDAFTLEARYENGEENNPYSLLEQGLKSFVQISSPKVEYNIGMIAIGALAEYSYMKHPEVGDKIKLPESLYLSYDDEETSYLVVTGYSESLRDFSSLSLSVEKDDESELLVAKMLQQSNFIKIGETKKKSNYVVPVPQELKHELPSISKSLKELEDSDLSIVNLFKPMLQ